MSIMEDRNDAKRGRPRGAKNIIITSEAVPSTCPACGCSDRTKYENSVYTDYVGVGMTFTDEIGLVVGRWNRSCHCTNCDVQRIVREKVYAPVEATAMEDAT